MVGLGLLYQGTGQRMIVEGLLAELYGKVQPGDRAEGRECMGPMSRSDLIDDS